MMSTLTAAIASDGTTDINGSSYSQIRHNRFTDIPTSIDIPIQDNEDVEGEEASVEVDLNSLPDDPTELCVLLDIESSTRSFWMYIALAYAKHGKIDQAIEMLTRGKKAAAVERDATEKLPMLGALVWLYLQKAREAPRVVSSRDAAAQNGEAQWTKEGYAVAQIGEAQWTKEGYAAAQNGEARQTKKGYAVSTGEARRTKEGYAVAQNGEAQLTKEDYLNLATATLNDSIRIDRDWTVNTLARGTISLMKSALTTNPTEKKNHMDTATKVFEEVYKGQGSSRNMFAAMARARILFATKKYTHALEAYQEVLLKRPDMDPDPRIGIGLCYWQLGYKDDAKIAWERALEIDPHSKVANILLGLYHLSTTTHLSETSPEFAENYRRAINEYTQRAYKLDKDLPVACTTFACYFFSRKGMTNVETLAKKAIDFTDINSVASDGYYLLARKCHYQGGYEMAIMFYKKCNESRFEKPRGVAGEEKGYLPARVGIGQCQILMKDFPSAKFTFEKILQHYPKCLEAMTILGTLYAEEVFATGGHSGISGAKEEVSSQHRKAIHLLETVRNSWKDPKRGMSANPSLLLTLAKLYEGEQLEKALQCLQQVEQLEKEAMSEDDNEESNLSPQLLNNIAVLNYHQGNYDAARELYQIALTTCANLAQKNAEVDTDALATTLSYNLARLEEAAENQEDAIKLYEGLLSRHEDYVDANMRLAYIYLRKNPEEGVKRAQKLMQSDGNNLEVRALYGWYLSRQKKKLPINVAEDTEMRHHKHSLQFYDKHDRYALTAMGNIYLLTAREMKKETEQDREKRRKMYEKAVEFFDKALQLDPKNAYAAQGIAIALVEDKRSFGQAVGIFTKLRETIKDGSVFLNLGHCLSGLEQWTRSIEAYDTALQKYQNNRDHVTFNCLGRVWYSKGRKEIKLAAAQSIESFKNALDYAKRALEIVPDQVVYQFNVAFVQFQLASTIRELPENQRSLTDMEDAAKGLDEAIKAFGAVARSKNPPYPASHIDQRATMGRNTLKGQLERAIESQKVYEEKNAAKLAEARRKREEEMRKREEAEQKRKQEEAERQRLLAEERRRMQEQAIEYARRKEEEERIRREREGSIFSEEEVVTGGQGERKGRKRKGRRGKKREDGTLETSESEGAEGHATKKSRRSNSKSAPEDWERENGEPVKKRKRLTKAGGGAAGKESKRKSRGEFKSAETVDSDEDLDDDDMMAMDNEPASSAPARTIGEHYDEDEDEEASSRRNRRKAKPRVLTDDEEGDLFGDEKNEDESVPIDPALMGSGADKMDVDE